MARAAIQRRVNPKATDPISHTLAAKQFIPIDLPGHPAKFDGRPHIDIPGKKKATSNEMASSVGLYVTRWQRSAAAKSQDITDLIKSTYSAHMVIETFWCAGGGGVLVNDIAG